MKKKWMNRKGLAFLCAIVLILGLALPFTALAENNGASGLDACVDDMCVTYEDDGGTAHMLEDGIRVFADTPFQVQYALTIPPNYTADSGSAALALPHGLIAAPGAADTAFPVTLPGGPQVGAARFGDGKAYIQLTASFDSGLGGSGTVRPVWGADSGEPLICSLSLPCVVDLATASAPDPITRDRQAAIAFLKQSYAVTIQGEPLAIYDEPLPFPFFTNVSLLSMEDGTDLNGKTGISKSDPLYLRYDWVIPNDVGDLNPGQLYQFHIPAEISVPATLKNYELIDASGKIVAHLNLTKGSQSGTVQFTNEVVGRKDISGYMQFELKFAGEAIDNADETTITFAAQGSLSETTYKIGFQKTKETRTENLSKTAQAQSDGSIKWTITFKPKTEPKPRPLTSIVLSDTIQSNQELVWDSAITPTNPKHPKLTYGGKATGTTAAGTLAYDSTAKKLTYTFTDPSGINLLDGETYTLTLYTRPTANAFDSVENGIGVEFKNDATVTGRDEKTTIAYDPADPANSGPNKDVNVTCAEQKVTIKKQLVTKEALSERIGDAQVITWTVTLNTNKLHLESLTAYDTLPSLASSITPNTANTSDFGGLVPYDDNSANHYGCVLKKDGTEIAWGTDGSSVAYDPASRKFTFSLGAIDDTYTVTYQTKLEKPDAVHAKNVTLKFKNSVELWGGPGPGRLATAAKDVSVSGGMGTKSGKYNRSTHEITWTIIANSYKEADLPDSASLKDIIQTGQEYVPGSVKINNTAVADDKLAIIGKEVTIPLKKPDGSAFGKNTVTVTLKTKVTDKDGFWGTNQLKPAGSLQEKKFQNKAALTYNSVTVDIAGEATGTSQVLSKRFVKYDYPTRTADWKIVFNQNGQEIENAKLVDTIPDDWHEFVPASVKIDGKAPSAAGAEVKFEPEGSDKPRKMTITFSSAVDKEYTVTYQTASSKLQTDTAENGKAITLQNSAVLEGGSIKSGGVTESAETEVKSILLEKTSAYEEGSSYIPWIVNINKNKQTMQDIRLVDTLQEGLELDTGSVELYKLGGGYNDGTGSGTREKITLTKDNILLSIDGGGRHVFRFVYDQEISDAYQLCFNTDIQKGYENASFSNSIAFEGQGAVPSFTSSPVQVSVGSASGGAVMQIGKITFTKRDRVTNNPLADAAFTLYDQYGFEKAIQVSGADGVITFDNLKYQTYRIKETGIPDGYQIDLDLEREAVLAQQTLTLPDWYNIPGTATLRLMKKDADTGRPIQGVTFTLYDKNQNPFSPPKTAVTDINGAAQFADLPLGTYYYQETAAPSLYQFDASAAPKIKAVLAEKDQAVSPEPVTNTQKKASLQIRKQDGTHGTALGGAQFRLTGPYGFHKTGTTSSDGKLAFDGLLYGESYLLEETLAPSGYMLPDSLSERQWTVCITPNAAYDNAEALAIENELNQNTVLFKKVNDLGYSAEGAQFQLHAVSNTSGTPLPADRTAASDENGLVRFGNVPHGVYELREVASPAHHILNPTAYTVEIAPDGSYSGLKQGGAPVTKNEIVNTVEKGSLLVTKVNRANHNRPLPGAVFELSDPLGNVVKTGATGPDGQIRFDDLAVGVPYTLRETKAPEGYLADAQPQTVRLATAGQTLPVMVENEVGLRSITFQKTDAQGNPLQGAEFALYQDDGDSTLKEENLLTAAPVTSDAEGAVLFADLSTGSYLIRELAPPDGYEKSDALYRAVIDVDGVFDGKLLNLSTQEEATAIVNERVPSSKEEPSFSYSGGQGTPDNTPDPKRILRDPAPQPEAAQAAGSPGAEAAQDDPRYGLEGGAIPLTGGVPVSEILLVSGFGLTALGFCLIRRKK